MTGSTGPGSDLVTAVVNLVGTGPVKLGAYTPAEVAAVGGLIDWLEAEPGSEAMAEAVRSLAARDLITTDPGSAEIEVRGDIGIALAFQQRSRTVLDARLTGTEPDRPWRFLVLPQPEQIALEVQIDTLGIHFYSLRKTREAMRRLTERLPRGDPGRREADFDATVSASPRTALVTITHWGDGDSRESTDVVLAVEGHMLHVFLRDPADPSRFAAQGMGEAELGEALQRLAEPRND